MRRVSLLLLAVVPMVFALLPANAYTPPGGGTFNVPLPWGGSNANWRIVKTVEKAINKTRRTKGHKRPVIHISTYLLDRDKSVDAMIRACRRGVQVRVLLDGDIDNKNSRRLITALNGDNVPDRNGDGKPDRGPHAGKCNRPRGGGSGGLRTRPHIKLFNVKQARRSVRIPTKRAVTWGRDGSYVKKCKGACRGRGGNMHSKFYLFSKTGKAKNVVMVSSSNLNRGGARRGWNDLVVLKNRPKSYRGYKRIHRAMTEDIRAGAKKVQINDGRYVSRFFPMRNAGRKNDPTLKDINRIRCKSGLGRTQIHVSMFYWKGKRGSWLLNALVRKARNGCKLRIIYGAPSIKLATRMRKLAGNKVLDLWDSRWDHNDDGYNEVRTHAKYVLVKGRVGKRRKTFQVWTGSQNWVGGSLWKSDESTINIRHKRIYKQYLRNWKKIKKHSRRLPYSQYPPRVG